MDAHKRTLIAIGDLHGDYYRFIRLLTEAELLDPETLRWREKAGDADIVLLGDYVDWRGEPLEGPRAEWPAGIRKLVDLIFKLYQENETLRRDPNYLGHFYPLCGNHDDMMMESHRTLEKIRAQESGILERYPSVPLLLDFAASTEGNLATEEALLGIINWYQQGGERTIQSFGGLEAWMGALEGALGNFLGNLPVAVVVNRKLFAHSIPDAKEYWVPLHRQETASREAYAKMREQYLWGRKIWGYDAFAGGGTRPFTENEIDEMLAKLEVSAVVVGHTPLHHCGPYHHFGGKVINLDTHGIPGSQAFVETYQTAPAEKKLRPKAARAVKKMKAWKRFGKH